MSRFVYFLMVGFAFVALQVATVEADMIPGTDCAATPGGPDAVAACWEAQAAGDENPPPSGTSAAGGPPTLTLEDPRCQLAPPDRDPGCPHDPNMAHDPPGDHPEIDTSHCDQFEGAPQVACIEAAESGPPGGDECAAMETPALVAACVASKTAAGN